MNSFTTKTSNPNPVVLTLDAGGTNFVFSAWQSVNGIPQLVGESFTCAAETQDLKKSLDCLVYGFQKVQKNSPESPAAISFAFPGPADYESGVTYNHGTNLPAYKGGVALGPYLQRIFNLPVFLNNDGDLFTYGEAQFGLLQKINSQLQKNGDRPLKNLVGVTLGTGFGGGLYANGQMYRGDNFNGLEVWTIRNALEPENYLEEAISRRAIEKMYPGQLSVKELAMVARGEMPGDLPQARLAFEKMGQVLGNTLADFATIFDANIVIGGGLARANDLFYPAMFSEMRRTFLAGNNKGRIVQEVYNLDNPQEFENYFSDRSEKVEVYGFESYVTANAKKRIGVGRSLLGTNQATSIGAYAYALSVLKS